MVEIEKQNLALRSRRVPSIMIIRAVLRQVDARMGRNPIFREEKDVPMVLFSLQTMFKQDLGGGMNTP